MCVYLYYKKENILILAYGIKIDMGRTAGVPNKLTSEVKEKLQTLVEGVVDALDITEITMDQKLKLFK